MTARCGFPHLACLLVFVRWRDDRGAQTTEFGEEFVDGCRISMVEARKLVEVGCDEVETEAKVGQRWAIRKHATKSPTRSLRG